ncbi:2OG-Fe(II) oxygenase family protein [Jatrophihabitans lederbergiae]|uniref:2OG-Fe(II) oxygenase family protein n=1 Tax=Jatrophihabitans lederbergiae TaxID=3075547 RepID=A0ABU2JI36_9ACTN|nr:2OG-Fe(II) oxygenase family protein [Jatrophihabitans sp. DSM 44399]MDT0263918.1 2OG-Fe(II) oxygenase family protein [Jatrophihabitans sp. DSM 44399]
MAEPVTAAMTGDALRFRTPEDRDTAMRSGVFLLEIPSDLDVSEADRLAAGFYDPGTLSPCGSSYRNLTSERFDDQLIGFHERSDQIEQFLLESRFWVGIYPEAVLQLAERLKTISRQVVREALGYAGVPEDSWPVGSGGCSDGAGSYHLTFNHYRPGERRTGLSSHKDDGFVTILRAVEPGLEVNVDRHWEVVPTGPDVLVVNFGLAIELLTRQAPRPISAILHRVVEQRIDRTSYALFSSSFCAPGRDAGIYGYSPATGLKQICESRQLIFENDHEIYEGTEKPCDD